MKMRIVLLSLSLFAMASLAVAQNAVDGKWTAEITTQRGPQNITFTFKAEGGKLTGSVEGGRGGAIPIEEGTIQGNTIKFKQKQQGRGGEVIMMYTGTVKGDEIDFSRQPEGQGNPVAFTAKRAK
jgi:hypothetical protein